MGDDSNGSLDMLRNWSLVNIVAILLVFIVAWLANLIVQRVVPWGVRKIWPNTRFFLLPWVPLLRLLIIIAAVVTITPLVIKPTPENLLALLAAGGLAIGFAFKDTSVACWRESCCCSNGRTG